MPNAHRYRDLLHAAVLRDHHCSCWPSGIKDRDQARYKPPRRRKEEDATSAAALVGDEPRFGLRLLELHQRPPDYESGDLLLI